MSAIDKIRNALRTALPSLALSAGSIEQKIVEVVGTYADSEALERENTVAVINSALANQKVTSIEYYRRKAVEYQPDDEILFDSVNQGAYYANPDPTRQLVKQACIVGEFPNYVMRVNKFDEATQHLAPLTQDELDGFDSYFAEFQPLGLNIDIQTKQPAIITDPNLTVYVRAGYDAPAIATNINDAFISKEKELRTTNKVTVSELTDIIQSITGVQAVGFSSSLSASDVDLQGQPIRISPVKGVFNLYTNAFTFGTMIDASMVEVLR